VVAFAAAFPSSALAQATRTWVSGVGDDANPCSRTAPCKTFAGAISKTAVGGEIDVLDPGGFGAVTITQSVTINADGVTGGVLVSGTNGITINAGSTGHVTLRGLDINGLSTGLNGVQVLSAASVRIELSRIYGFTLNGVDFEPTNPGARLLVQSSEIYDNNGDGVAIAPQAGATTVSATLRQDEIDGNTCGVVAGAFGLAASPNFSTNCGMNSTGTGRTAMVLTARSDLFGNSVGVESVGALATNNISGDTVSGNTTGLKVVVTGKIVSFADNELAGNTTDGVPTSTKAHH
jgi:hypothetical protein